MLSVPPSNFKAEELMYVLSFYKHRKFSISDFSSHFKHSNPTHPSMMKAFAPILHVRDV